MPLGCELQRCLCTRPRTPAPHLALVPLDVPCLLTEWTFYLFGGLPPIAQNVDSRRAGTSFVHQWIAENSSWSTWQVSGEGGKRVVSLLLSVQIAPEQCWWWSWSQPLSPRVFMYPGPGHLWESEWQEFARKGPGASWGKDQVIGSWFWCGRLMCVHLIGI